MAAPLAGPVMGGVGDAPGNLMPKYEVKGAGAFGAVVKPALPNEIDGVKTNYPNNVTKLFYNETSFKEALGATSRITNVMNARSGPNVGHIAKPYTKKYKSSNLPENLVSKLIKDSRGRFDKTKNLYLMRMPDLGVDLKIIDDLVKGPKIRSEIRRIPVRIILGQILKLFQQTASLADHKYGHFDISRKNLMINPVTGIMTIIDFDWMNSYSDLIKKNYPFGFYLNPPECLLRINLRNWNDIFRKNADDDYIYNEYEITKYVNPKELDAYASYQLSEFGIKHSYFGIKEKYQMIAEINGSNESNIYEFRQLYDKPGGEFKGKSEDIFYKVLSTYDNFSLSLALLELMAVIYPSIIDTRVDDDTFISTLETRLKNGEGSYTHPQIVIIAKTLRELSNVLKKLSSFWFADRKDPKKVPGIIQDILNKFDTAWGVAERGGDKAAVIAAYNSRPPLAPVPAPVNEPAEGGASLIGGRRQTRYRRQRHHSRSHRKKTKKSRL